MAGASVIGSSVAAGSAGAEVGSACAAGASVAGAPQAANSIEAIINMVMIDQNVRLVFIFLLSIQKNVIDRNLIFLLFYFEQ